MQGDLSDLFSYFYLIGVAADTTARLLRLGPRSKTNFLLFPLLSAYPYLSALVLRDLISIIVLGLL